MPVEVNALAVWIVAEPTAGAGNEVANGQPNWRAADAVDSERCSLSRPFVFVNLVDRFQNLDFDLGSLAILVHRPAEQVRNIVVSFSRAVS